jgi:hypothetical protein
VHDFPSPASTNAVAHFRHAWHTDAAILSSSQHEYSHRRIRHIDHASMALPMCLHSLGCNHSSARHRICRSGPPSPRHSALQRSRRTSCHRLQAMAASTHSSAATSDTQAAHRCRFHTGPFRHREGSPSRLHLWVVECAEVAVGHAREALQCVNRTNHMGQYLQCNPF